MKNACELGLFCEKDANNKEIAYWEPEVQPYIGLVVLHKKISSREKENETASESWMYK